MDDKQQQHADEARPPADADLIGDPKGSRGPQFTGVLKPLAVIDDLISRFEAVVLACGVLVMATVSVANVVGRFVFGESLFFAEELNQFLIVLITFVGIGYAARKGRHIRMSAIYDSLPDLWRKVLMIVIALTTAAAMFVLAYYAYIYVDKVAATGRVAPSLRVPVYLTLLWVPVGFVITGIQYTLTAVVNMVRPDVYLSVSIVDSFDESEQQL
jgi:TRAP-type C4-dicarboxylate transport system permease small subunit